MPAACSITRATSPTIRSKRSPIRAAWSASWLCRSASAKAKSAIEDMLKHMDYMIKLVGIEHLALGMDFVKYDGPRTLKDRHHPLHKDPLIKGFEEIEDLPNLIDGLQKHGYKDEEIKIDSRRQLSARAEDDLAGTVGDLIVFSVTGDSLLSAQRRIMSLPLDGRRVREG